jgi:hypothetical protein
MTIRHHADNEPVNLRRLPPLDGSVLANRLRAPTSAIALPTFYVALSAGSLLVGVVIVLFGEPEEGPWGSREKAFVLALTALPLAMVLGHHWYLKSRPVRRPSIAEVFRTWDALVEALRSSPYAVDFRGEIIRERDHLFLGVIHGSGKPLLLHNIYLNRPAIFLGRTGSGKTKLIAEPLLVQAIRRREMHIFIIDLKGDRAFMRGLGIAAARSKVDFKWLTIETGKSSYLWNPFTDPGVRLLTQEQIIQIVLRALSLVTGQQHGAGYFGAMQEERTRRTFEQHDLRSFRDLYRIVREQRAADIGMSERDFSNAGHLIANLARIASVGVLNAVPDDDIPAEALRESISLLNVLSRPGVTYINLPAQLEPTTALFTGKIIVHFLAAIAKVLERQGVPVLVFCDEQQEMLGPDLATPIRQARESGVSFWMGCQDLAGLNTEQGDFASAVLGNTPLKIFCTAEDEEGRNYIKQTSGETFRPVHSVTSTTTQTPQGWSRGTGSQYREEAIPRIGDEEINRVNRDPNAVIVMASESKGFTQFRFPVIVRTTFAISPAEFERRQAMPWPAGNRFTVTVKHEPFAGEAEAAPEVPQQQATAKAIENAGPAVGPPPAKPQRRRGRPPKTPKAVDGSTAETTRPEADPPAPPPEPPAGPTAPPKPRPSSGADDMAEYLRRLAQEAGGDDHINGESSE